MAEVYCGIELGGQTAAIAIFKELGEFIYKKKGIPTREPITPSEAVENIAKEIQTYQQESGCVIKAIGIATFGPVFIKKGQIGVTPKPLWSNFPLVAEFQKHFKGIPISIETDVNAPAYSEFQKYSESHPEACSLAYATIGTGVGVGACVDGHTIHGRMHPEVGHIKPVMHPKDSEFKGGCPFHGQCVEGLVSAVAIAERLGIKPNELQNIPDDHYVWEAFADYVGQLAASCALMYSLDAFVIGGGIVTAKGREFLIERIKEATERHLNGYIHVPDVIVPYYSQDAGLVGACAVAINPSVFPPHSL